MTMERRAFLKSAALGVAGTSAVAACGGAANGPASAGEVVTGPEVTWRLASSFPRSLDIIYGSVERFAARVGQLTGGRFTIRTYPAGELVPGLQVMDAVQQGTVHAGHSATYYYLGKNPALAFDTGVPFGLTARQQNAWLGQGGGRDALRPIFAEFGIVQFACGNTGTQFGGWFRQPITSVADLRGLRMRMPGLGGEVMSKLGVSVQTLAGGEIYPALERGAIDATEWIGPHDDEKLGFHQIAKNYYYPGWHEPGVSLTLMVNQEALDALPEVYRHVVEVAAAEQNHEMLERYDASNPPALARLRAAGVEVRPFPEEVLEAVWRESQALLDGYAAQSAQFKAIYEPWKTYRQESFRYFSGVEQAYANFAFPKVG
ncbi:MAG: TRAP transporter substrate-binding protein DctP [Gemmatimonadales bacterium]|nr:TRAP transporter substrate-binding protein DctP [Gemmatimonadales bacterium]